MGVKGLTLYHLKSHLQVNHLKSHLLKQGGCLGLASASIHNSAVGIPDSYDCFTCFLPLSSQKFRLGKQPHKELNDHHSTKDATGRGKLHHSFLPTHQNEHYLMMFLLYF